jgi:hypothetical protein
MPSQFFTTLNIHPWSWNSLGSKILAGADDSISDVTDVVYPEANMAIYIPFFLQHPMTFNRLFSENGDVVSGNIDLGVYDAGKRRIVSSGSTAQVGTATSQLFNVGSFTLGPGLYFMAVAMDNTTGKFMALALSPLVGLGIYKTFGIYQQSSAFPLPANATFATPTRNYLPVIGLTPRSLL